MHYIYTNILYIYIYNHKFFICTVYEINWLATSSIEIVTNARVKGDRIELLNSYATNINVTCACNVHSFGNNGASCGIVVAVSSWYGNRRNNTSMQRDNPRTDNGNAAFMWILNYPI